MTPEEASAGESVGPSSSGAYPLVVFGGGPAGVFAAQAAARRGVRAALVVPPVEEVQPPEPTPLGEMIRAIQVRTGLASPGSLPDLPGVDVYVGRAVFHRHRTIAIGDRELSFRRAIIATGTKPAAAAFDVAEQSGWFRPETLGRLTEIPQRLAMIGLGAEGCAWAAAFCRLGSQVHLIGHDAGVLSTEDPEAAAAIRSRLEQDGVRLHPSCGELAIETTGNFRSVVLRRDGRKEKLLVDEVLFCAARHPLTGDLNLGTAAVACDAQGILVDNRLRTSNRRIYAAGAVCGPVFDSPQAARATAELAVHNAVSWFPRSLGRLVLSRTTATEPAIARAALGRAETGPAEVNTLYADLAEADATLPERLREGFVKIGIDRRTGRLVEALVVAHQADELLAPLALLMTRRLPLYALVEPTVSSPSRLDVLVHLASRTDCPIRPA